MNLSNINLGNPVNWTSPLNRGLLSWWMALPTNKGGDTLFDLCGRSNGTLTNMDAASDWVPIPYGMWALDYDGSNDGVPVGNFASGIFSGDFAVLMRLRITSFAATRILFDKRTAAASGFRIYADQTSGAFSSTFSTTDVQQGTFTAGANHILVVGRTGTTVRHFLDGVQVGSDGSHSGSVSNSVAAVIGSRSFTSQTASQLGIISDVRVWDRYITANEVALLTWDALTGYPQTLQRKVRLGKPTAPAPAGGTNHHFLPLLGAA